MSSDTSSASPIGPRSRKPTTTPAVAAIITNVKMVWTIGAHSRCSVSPMVNRDIETTIPIRSRIDANSTAASISSTVPNADGPAACR